MTAPAWEPVAGRAPVDRHGPDRRGRLRARRRRLLRPATPVGRFLLLAVAIVVPALLGFVALDTLGAVSGGASGYCLALAMTRAEVATAPRPPRTRRPVPHLDAGFPRYRAIASAVAWAAHSARHRDRVLAPVLREVVAARLAERHAVDLVRDPARARVLLGPDLWFLVDPARPASEDSSGGGLDETALRRALTIVEAL